MTRDRLAELSQKDPALLSADEWRDIVSLADDGLTFRLLSEQGHVVEFTEDGYGLEHPVTCRIQARLLDCPVDQAVRALSGNPFGEAGRYRVIIGDAGVLEGWRLP